MAFRSNHIKPIYLELRKLNTIILRGRRKIEKGKTEFLSYIADFYLALSTRLIFFATSITVADARRPPLIG